MIYIFFFIGLAALLLKPETLKNASRETMDLSNDIDIKIIEHYSLSDANFFLIHMGEFYYSVSSSSQFI